MILFEYTVKIVIADASDLLPNEAFHPNPSEMFCLLHRRLLFTARLVSYF